MSLLRKRGRYERRGVRSVFGSLGLVGGLLAVAVAGPAVVAGAASASEVEGFNPFDATAGFGVYVREDAHLGNHETEGTIAVGGTLSVRSSGGEYAIKKGSGEAPVPMVDEGPTRLLIGALTTSPAEKVKVSVGFARVVALDDPAFHVIGRDGATFKLKSADEAGGPAVASPDWAGKTDPFRVQAASVEDALHPNGFDYAGVARCLAALPTAQGSHVLTAGDLSGPVELKVELAAGKTNVLDYGLIPAGISKLTFGSVQPSVDTPLVVRVDAGTRTVRVPDLVGGAVQAEYVMWDLSAVSSAVSGAVSVESRAGRIDGSIYAPDADLSFAMSSPIEGQIFAKSLRLDKGKAEAELHSRVMFKGLIPCAQPEPEPKVGSFSVVKTVEGKQPAAGATFAVQYSYGTGIDAVSKTVKLNSAGTFRAEVSDVPLGTTVTLTETVLDTDWATPKWTIGNQVTSGASVSFEVTEAQQKVTVVLDNTPRQTTTPEGFVKVEKQVVGGGVEGLPAVFDITYVVGTEEEKVTLGDGGSALIGPFPVGTRVAFGEIAPSLPEGIRWESAFAGLAPDRSLIVAESTEESAAVVAVTNTFSEIPPAPSGSFQITKQISDGALAELPEGTKFTVKYLLNGDPQTDLVLDASDDFQTSVDGLAVDDQVALTEVGLGDAWDAPSWAGDVVADGASVAFTITDSEQGVSLVLTNTPIAQEPEFGSFSVTKELTGAAALQVPPGTPFTIGYSVNGGDVQSLPVVVGEPAPGPELEVGATVTFSEPSFPVVAGVEWGTPIFSQSTVVIGSGEPVSVVVTNTANVPPGTPPGNPPNNPPPNNPPVDTPPDTPETEVLGDRVTAEPEDEAAVAVEVEGDRVLAFTGAEPRNMIVAALVLVVAGLGALVLRRRPAEG